MIVPVPLDFVGRIRHRVTSYRAACRSTTSTPARQLCVECLATAVLKSSRVNLHRTCSKLWASIETSLERRAQRRQLDVDELTAVADLPTKSAEPHDHAHFQRRPKDAQEALEGLSDKSFGSARSNSWNRNATADQLALTALRSTRK